MFFPPHPTSPSVPMERALLPAGSVHLLYMTNLHCQVREGRSGEGKEGEKRGKKMAIYKGCKLIEFISILARIIRILEMSLCVFIMDDPFSDLFTTWKDTAEENKHCRSQPGGDPILVHHW